MNEKEVPCARRVLSILHMLPLVKQRNGGTKTTARAYLSGWHCPTSELPLCDRVWFHKLWALGHGTHCWPLSCPFPSRVWT